jgi:hypothetical protein
MLNIIRQLVATARYSRLRSQFMVGDTWTASDVFDSARLRGVRLYTDDDMLPASMNGFAPVVRGVAKSNAMVTIGKTVTSSISLPYRKERLPLPISIPPARVGIWT